MIQTLVSASGKKTGKHIFLFFDPKRICLTLVELVEIYGSGQKTRKHIFRFFDPKRIFLTLVELVEIYGSGQKNRKHIFLFFDPKRIFLTHVELVEIHGSGQKTGKHIFRFLTRTVYFNELDEREKYTFRVKKQENVFSGFLTRPGLLATLGWR